MIGNLLLLTTAIFLAVTFFLMEECRFLIPYRHLLWVKYSGTIAAFATVLFRLPRSNSSIGLREEFLQFGRRGSDSFEFRPLRAVCVRVVSRSLASMMAIESSPRQRWPHLLLSNPDGSMLKLMAR